MPDLDLDFFAAKKDGLAKLRFDCLKAQNNLKSPTFRAHYQAIIEAIDSRQSKGTNHD